MLAMVLQSLKNKDFFGIESITNIAYRLCLRYYTGQFTYMISVEPYTTLRSRILCLR